MYYYTSKNKTCHPATSHRSAVLFPYICAIACVLLSRSSLVLVIFCRYIINILNETSKPPVNSIHFFNIAHLLFICLT